MRGSQGSIQGKLLLTAPDTGKKSTTALAVTAVNVQETLFLIIVNVQFTFLRGRAGSLPLFFILMIVLALSPHFLF